MLRASHIKPWAQSSNEERLSADNGFLLSANLDALFDRHLISFLDNGEMLISHRLKESHRADLNLTGRIRLPLESEEKNFLSIHRDIFYKTENI